MQDFSLAGQFSLWPLRSSARVVVWPGEQSLIDRTARRFFGRVLQSWEYAGLCGAPDDVVVEVDILGRGLCLDFYQPEQFSCTGVRLVRWREHAATLVNDGLHICGERLQQQSMGLQILRRELCHARRLGIRHISATAGRRDDENGYYTWPRLGFDGPLPRPIFRQLPCHLRSARSVLDLMDTDSGRQWWREHGTTIQVVFDLASGSRSSRTFQRYLSRQFTSATAGVACNG